MSKNYRFEYLAKSHLESLLPDLFRILYSNMNAIASTGNTYETDFEEWYSCVFPAMQKTPRQIVLMYSGDDVVGFFQYYISTDSLMMEEIQIKSEYQGTGIFGLFYAWLIDRLPKDLQFVEAYSNKKNLKSQGILEHLGLVKCGENKNGNSFYYKGDYAELLGKYFQKR